MKRLVLSIIVVASLAVSACGGSSPSHSSNTQDQVRQLYGKVLTALTSKTPEDACQYYRPQDNSKCVGAMIMIKAFKTSPSSIVSYGWQNRLAHAQIVVNGNTATIVSWVASKSKGSNAFTRIDGQWYKNGGS